MIHEGRARGPRPWRPGAVALAALALLALCGPTVADVHGYAARPRLARAAAPPAGAIVRTIDPFESAAAWKPMPADGVEMTLSTDSGFVGRSLRIDFRFVKGGGYAVLHRDVSLDLPDNYRFLFRVRGACPTENLELKLVDSTGANVWWCNRRDFAFPREWQRVSTKKRQIPFAWGPFGGGEIRHVAAIEFAVTAGSGGSGTVWLDQLELEALPPADGSPPRPVASASSAERGHAPALAVDGDSTTTWRSRVGDARPSLTLDLGEMREFSAVLVDWAGGRRPRDYALEASEDGRTWGVIRRVKDGGGARDWLFLPEREARWLRLRATRPISRPCTLAELTIEPVDWAKDANAFFEHVAQASPRGWYPRGTLGEQAYWTVVSGNGGPRHALFSEDGAIEFAPRGFSVEPFVVLEERPVTWADVSVKRTLLDGDLPVPVVEWVHPAFSLRIEAFTSLDFGGQLVREASDRRDDPMWAFVRVRYRLSNPRRETLHASLGLALRPFQVNPPSQFLNGPGGVAPITYVTFDENIASVNHETVAVLSRYPGFSGVVRFDEGHPFAKDTWSPHVVSAEDSSGTLSGACLFPLAVAPGDTAEIGLLLNSYRGPRLAPSGLGPGAQAERIARIEWDRSLGTASISLPDSDVAHSLRAQIGWILASRDSAALRPGTRAYARSWIRDGALISSALLRMGKADVVRDYIDWFAPYQYADGKVPCCVDGRGSDPVPEHDSHGELVYLVADYVRFTGDMDLARRAWPHVRAAVAYLDTLRAQRRTQEWRAAGRGEFYGLLPPSISHEGYSAKPMHSYWDDLFALRGYKDAAWLAGLLGRRDDQERIAASRDAFARDLRASVAAAMAAHRIDYVPGCADLGDFDATSTTIAFDPVQAESLLGRRALERTFERYWEFFRDRRDGRQDWEDYTPYEMRTIGAFVRLGWRDRADSLLQWFMQGQRPAGWRQWPEVVWKDARAPHFLGDLPHAWVGSDFVRSLLDMLAYEREGDSALVIGAGVPERWARDGEGVSVKGLQTTRGALSYTMRAAGRGIETRIESGVRLSAAGALVSPPGIGRGWGARVNGTPVTISPAGAIRVTRLPATILASPP